MPASVVRVALQICLFAFSALRVSGVQKLTISPDRGSIVVISNKVRGSACVVCADQGRSPQCGASARLSDAGAASLEFNCSRPQDVFTVEILRYIKCTSKLCDGIVLIETPGSLPLSDFDRIFTWNLTIASSSSTVPTFRIDFTKTGLRQIEPTQSCPDKHTYILEALRPPGQVVAIGTYCRDGAVRGAQVQNQGRFSLKVLAKQKLQAALFPVSVGEKIKSLASIQVVLKEGTSSSELLSPNYPDSLPDDAVMEWDIQVAAKHSATVQFVNHTQPRCRKSRAAMEYLTAGTPPGRGGSVLELAARQATPIRGNFSLTLSNCDMDRSRANSPGLSVHFKVSALRTSFPVQCSVDLTKKKGLSLNIEKTTPDSDCEMQMDSVPQGKISVPAGKRAQLSFQDCYPEDLLIVTRQIIECPDLRGCSSAFALTVPDLRNCPPAPLSSMTWTLRPPLHGTVELWPSASTGLQQSLPEQRCNNSASLKISEDDGTSVGQFCPQGPVQKMQIHSNVSVVVSRLGDKELVASQSLLNARFNKEIDERYIFTVSPKKGTTTRLATPGWPAGMKPYSTVAWIVSVPAKMEASIKFANASRPKCGNRHTNIGVRGLSSPEEIYSRREDEATSDILVSETFYLNMSNCMPESGQFSVISQITLQKNKNLILTIVLSVVAVLCVLTITILAVVCVVIRKKKKKLSHQVSIYNPNGASFLPGPNGFPKSREDNESHVYASIEDELVYTHLLKKGEDSEMEVYGEVDTYQPFTGPTDLPGPSRSAGGDAEHMKVGVYQSYVPQSQQAPPLPNRPASHGPPMVDNELYGTEIHGEADGSSHHSEEVVRGPRLDPEGGD